MKLRSEDNELLTNVGNSKTFTIAATAKAFQILSSSLYERKIEAIVRELSCNAYDSHVQAGCADKPFKINLPTEWEPTFSIEDFGLGLSDKDVEDIYTSYFTSTKTNSNDVIGALGLGSKTPFSYTDTFNIISRKDGIEYHYNAHISASGEPAVSLLSKHETEDSNGVLISLPVNTSDFHEFKSCTQKVLKWFKVLPEFNVDMFINNDKAIKLKEEGIIFEEYRKDGYNKDFIVALMGNVAYTVSGVSGKFSENFTTSELSFFQNNGLYINFAIGDLDVAASRETISFDPETKKVFVQVVKDAIKSYTKKTQDIIDVSPTYIEAFEVINKEIGFWAYGMFEFDGANIYDLSQMFLIDVLKNVEEYSGDVVDDKFYMYSGNRYKYYNFSDYNTFRVATTVGKDNKIIIIENADRNPVQLGRRVAGNNYKSLVFTCPGPANQKFIDSMNKEFGEYVTYLDGNEINATIKEERRLVREQNKIFGNSKKTSTTERVKKKQVRLTRYVTPTEDKMADCVMDVDDLPKKVALFKMHYSMLDGPINLNDSDLQFVCKAFNLDAIIVCSGQSYERNLREMGDKGIHDKAYFSKSSNHDKVLLLDCFLKDTFNLHNCKFMHDIMLSKLPDDHIIKVVSNRIKSYKMNMQDSYELDSKLIDWSKRKFYSTIAENLKMAVDKEARNFYDHYPMLSYVPDYTLRNMKDSDNIKVFEYMQMIDQVFSLQELELPIQLQDVA